jgi:sarcosine oxidase subunit gamma
MGSASVFERRSPLSALIAQGGRDGADGARALRLSEVHGWDLVQVGVCPDREKELAAIVEPLVGTQLPANSNTPAVGRARIYRIAPDQYWVISSDSTLWAELVRAIPPTAGSVTALSDARVRLAIAGSPVRDCLAKGISIDLHPNVFAMSAFAQTGLQHTGVLLERTGDSRFELYVLRTFAVSIWEWLIDAALAFGYDTSVEEV